MKSSPKPPWVANLLANADRVWLFLDYDGTLAELAPTPEHVSPDQDVVDLVTGLAGHPAVRVAVISGRRLSHVEKLVPVPGAFLAGTYGVELRMPDGRRVNRANLGVLRPALDQLKLCWQQLVGRHPSFFLEDKGWALALHGRYADHSEAETVLAEARQMAVRAIQDAPAALYRLLGGQKFLEVGPAVAHKGRTVDYILEECPWPGALLVYMGDDDKDEEAFEVIKTRGGIAVLVARDPRETRAEYRLETPRAARDFLRALSGHLEEGYFES